MIRRAWAMQLKPGCEAAYKAAHDAIWPEMLALMQQSGVMRFDIFRHGLTLFAVQDRIGAPPDAPPDPVMRRWWAHMAPLMETHPDNRPIQTELDLMFRFDASTKDKPHDHSQF
ncbi:L-rhamnose mutarotase [Pseudorhodobacter sp. E13]|uniref:L-rhamnose mutarotase n=1 Tax=Pseudorhodobacter sp. E13 TaxID=2487931 RepID=UPI000F8C8DD2|nr:L-rhamnose mutarotase [Pseudorhodobacter sp. E13]RUS65032.1 L-rhamnose mutarotase [Pseudorhodobacter sp. E13]